MLILEGVNIKSTEQNLRRLLFFQTDERDCTVQRKTSQGRARLDWPFPLSHSTMINAFGRTKSSLWSLPSQNCPSMLLHTLLSWEGPTAVICDPLWCPRPLPAQAGTRQSLHLPPAVLCPAQPHSPRSLDRTPYNPKKLSPSSAFLCPDPESSLSPLPFPDKKEVI